VLVNNTLNIGGAFRATGGSNSTDLAVNNATIMLAKLNANDKIYIKSNIGTSGDTLSLLPNTSIGCGNFYMYLLYTF
jgi:hypothetical protein